ncbi:MAG: group III truncated hemoglobin [Bacteroidetes bacterium]|nr:MAG: group III truncated hemoglobin [Bacteroidota bacterium]
MTAQKHDIKTSEDVRLMVDTFYQNLQKNDSLNHVFNRVAQVDWNTHLPKMYSFWETLLFHKASYKGNPMEAHRKVNNKEPFTMEMFQNWLDIFRETVNGLFEGPNAIIAVNKAENIAKVLQAKLLTEKTEEHE